MPLLCSLLYYSHLFIDLYLFSSVNRLCGPVAYNSVKKNMQWIFDPTYHFTHNTHYHTTVLTTTITPLNDVVDVGSYNPP